MDESEKQKLLIKREGETAGERGRDEATERASVKPLSYLKQQLEHNKLFACAKFRVTSCQYGEEQVVDTWKI